MAAELFSRLELRIGGLRWTLPRLPRYLTEGTVGLVVCCFCWLDENSNPSISSGLLVSLKFKFAVPSAWGEL